MGSGVRNLYKYTKIYSGGEPELIEGDIFKTIIPMRSDINGSKDLRNGIMQVNTQDGHVNGHVNGHENGHVNGHVNEHEKRKNEIIAALKDNPKLTLRQIAEKANISYRTVRREMDAMREKGIIKRIGSDKSGHWEVIEL